MCKYWYCGVAIKGSQNVYSYISDSGELDTGTYVIVPFGIDNTLKVGVVKWSAEYTAEEAPYPVEKTKHIIRQATKKECEYDKCLYISSDDDDCNIIDDTDDIEWYIEIGDWDNVFEWACRHHDTLDPDIGLKVMECYELCFKHGNATAALNLGTFYYNGRFVGRDYKKAFELYKIAADAGEIRAICNCGYCFYYGRHERIDYAKAYEYFSLGALLYDDANCLYKLGDMYINGYGVTQNELYAYILYNRALNISIKDEDYYCIGDAQFRLGKCLLYGKGTEQDAEQAHEMLSYALLNFYKRRKNDSYVSGLIKSTKKLLNEAQQILDDEITYL